MVKIYINECSFLVKEHLSILEACQSVGVQIKRFCFHESLSVSGNCRMCLVEIENSRKIQASCVNEIFSKIEIYTDTPYVKKLRENIIESLLMNHPLDCPICDQGGECDLQEQAQISSKLFTRYFYNKKGTFDKNFGPIIQSIMTRCILCTRCVRYTTEISNSKQIFGTLGRGDQTEIGLYLNKTLDSEISGNVIDLCPVGALTSKPYGFSARPWELSSEESIDLLDGLGSNIFFNYKHTEINRIIPKINNEINGSFISDKIRFFFDSLNLNRLKRTHYNKNVSENLMKIYGLKKKLFFIVEDTISTEKLLFLKNFSFINNCVKIVRHTTIKYKNIFFDSKVQLSFFLNNLDNYLLIVASNLRFENAIINSKIKFITNNKNIKIFNTGFKYSSTFNNKLIFLSILDVCYILEGKHIMISNLIVKNKLSVILSKYIENRFLNELKFILLKIDSMLNILSVNLHSNTFGLDLFNIKTISLHKINNQFSFFVLNEDSFNIRKIFYSYKPNLSLWLNSIGSQLLQKSDIVIPLESEYDSIGIFFNLEGRPQKSYRTVSDYFTLEQILCFFFSKKKMILFKAKKKYLNFIKEFLNNKLLFLENKDFFLKSLLVNNNISKILLTNEPSKSSIEDFYRFGALASNSSVLGSCSRHYRKYTNQFNL